MKKNHRQKSRPSKREKPESVGGQKTEAMEQKRAKNPIGTENRLGLGEKM